MKNVKHGTIYRIPLLENTKEEGYGYVRILKNDTLFHKPDGYFIVGKKLVQFLKLYSTVAINSYKEFEDIKNIDLFCHPHHLFGSIPTRGQNKWVNIGVLEELPALDYAPAYNQNLDLLSLQESKKREHHRIVFDELNRKESFAYISPERVMHLPTSMRKNYEVAKTTLNHFWAIEKKLEMEDICKSIGYTLDLIKELGGLGPSWLYANYYYSLFPKLPIEYRGVPLPKGDSIDNYINIEDYDK